MWYPDWVRHWEKKKEKKQSKWWEGNFLEKHYTPGKDPKMSADWLEAPAPGEGYNVASLEPNYTALSLPPLNINNLAIHSCDFQVNLFGMRELIS